MVFALFMAAAAVVPSQAFAQSCTTATAYYGELLQTADLDGNGTLDAVCNGYSEINVVSGSAATRYPLSNTPWTLASVVDVDGSPGAEVVLKQGNQLTLVKHYARTTAAIYIGTTAWDIGAFTDVDAIAGNEIAITTPTLLRIVYPRTGSITDHYIGTASHVAAGAIADMDGLPGNEIPLEAGSNLVVYGRNTGLRTNWVTSGTNWKICADIANCASDMNGVAGAELLLALPSEVKVYSLKSGALNSYWIGSQYATLDNGVRDLDGLAGNDVAMAQGGGSGNLLILRPAVGTLQTINGAGSFGSTWTLVGYANLDGVAGDEIRIRSNTNNRVYRVYPRSGTVSVE
ncbi:hypothetical protein OCJ37_15800 [Xanthomonas sp. AM6]|uniref:hypothetical protein n=1 Tax=Xanthomonas sp. AM6 TaxID=2982531 RepID=UPI0021DA4ED8|nr:hypothetical protein [Xanthomonas sp. AM6]UYB51429.1 hypothetical protein OCJ37_15800 [Xanthomonas sp. AM6]